MAEQSNGGVAEGIVASEASACQEDAAKGHSRSRSGSSSSSSSSSSSRSRSPAVKFQIDDRVEVTGLTSADGRMLNGRVGSIVQYIKVEDKYEVSFGKDRLVILKSDYLRKCASEAAAVAPAVAQPDAKANATGTSLASLLGMGRQEAARVENIAKKEWQPVWARNTTEGQVQVGGITEDQQEELEKLHADEEREAQRKNEIRKQIVEEFAQSGVFENEMIEEAYKQRLEQRQLRMLQTGRSRSRSKG